MDELKPCPFCGSKAEIYQHGDDYDSPWAVECVACFATLWPRKNKEDAIKEWNRRADNG